MTEQVSYTRVGRLLRLNGVGTRISGAEAAELCGVSRETISRLMRDKGQTHRIQKETLDKLSAGLGIQRDLLGREALADWGYSESAEADDVQTVLQQFANLSQKDQLRVQAEIIRMQQARLEE